MPDSTGEQGFTLIELLVVSVLLAVMSAILYGTLNGIIRGNTMVENERDTARVAQYVLERMTRELSSRVQLQLSVIQQNSADSRNPVPSVFEGGSEQAAGGDRGYVRFVCLNGAQAFYNAIPNYGLVEIGYHLEDSANKTFGSISRPGSEGRHVLVRVEVPADVQNKDIIKKKTLAFPLAEDVASLRFRFMKDGKWLSEWKNQSAQLPQAVEITLKLVTPERKTETYRTAVSLNRALKKTDQGLPTATQ